MLQIMSEPEVRFEVPDWDSLDKMGMMSADMHFHTRHSDSMTDVKEALKLAGERKVGLAITDHNLIGGVKEAFHSRCSTFVIPGMEISAWDGPHILVYFYDEKDLYSYWEKNIKYKIQSNPCLAIRMNTLEIIDSLEKENCVISAAHPMGYFMFNKGMQKCINREYLTEDTASRIDAYEVICSGMKRQSNLDALQYSRKYHIGCTGGTDGHMLCEVGNVVTSSKADSVDEFLDNIKKGNNKVIGTEKNTKMKIAMGASMSPYYFQHIPSSLEIHYKQNVVRVKHYIDSFKKVEKTESH